MSKPNVLLFDNYEEHIAVVAAALNKHASVVRVHSVAEVRAALEHQGAGRLPGKPFDAFFCAWTFQQQWRQALRAARRADAHLPVIILSRQGGEEDAFEILEAGGFDLLVAPYDKSVVLAVLAQAVASKAVRELGIIGGPWMIKAS